MFTSTVSVVLSLVYVHESPLGWSAILLVFLNLVISLSAVSCDVFTMFRGGGDSDIL